GLPASPFRTDDWAEAAPVAKKAPATAAVAPPPAPAPATKSTPVYASQIAMQIEATREVVYKTIEGRGLRLFVLQPQSWKAGDNRPCYVGIHGGGWTSGSPRSMYPFAQHCVEQGMVGISVEYRLYKPNTPVTVFECVKDVRSALRYIRAHATELGIDPQKIA